jgi:stage II sporulation protein M
MRFRFWVLIAGGLFVIGIGAGIAAATVMPDGIAGFFSEQASALGDIGDFLGPFSLTMLAFIYIKNTLVLVVSFPFGPFLCIVPVIALLFNSAFLSYIAAMVVREKSLSFLLAGLLPHGIFEIPALIIGEAAALNFGVAMIVALFTRDRGNRLLPRFKANLKYLLIALALLVPAAIIETFVTPKFLS